MEVHKLISKHGEAGGRLLKWVNLANELNNLRRPPCTKCSHWFEKGIRFRLRRLIVHFLFCREEPWKGLNHRSGELVDLKEIERIFPGRFPNLVP